MRRSRYHDFDEDVLVWKGAVAGVIGGLVASLVTNQFQAGLSKASEALTNGGDGKQAERDPQSQQQREDEDAS